MKWYRILIVANAVMALALVAVVVTEFWTMHRQADGWDGHVLWLVAIASALTIGIVLLVRQFNQADARCRRARQDLVVTQQRLASILSSVPEVIWSVEPGCLAMIYVSPAAADLYGQPPEFFVRLPQIWSTVIHPADRARVTESFARADWQAGGYAAEYRIIRPDGTIRHVHDRGRAQWGSHGEIQRIDGIVTDITRNRTAKLAARAGERRIRAILDTVVDGVITIDENGIIETFNHAAERIFGYRAEEVVGGSVDVLMPASLASEHGGHLRCHRQAHEPRAFGHEREAEVEGRRKDGSTVPISLSIGELSEPPAEGELGKHRGRTFIGTVRDLTAQQDLARQLRQAQKMEAIGQLTGGIAHDFNNLLTVVIGNLELANERVPDFRVRHALLQPALRAALRGAELNQRLLAFARQQPLKPAAVDLGHLVTGMRDLLKRSIGERYLIQAVTTPGLWPSLADPGQVENALLNLAINARDAMPDGGAITVRTANHRFEAIDSPFDDLEPGEYVTLSVSDTGTGMPPEVRERVFEPFFTTKEPGRGSGLGLSMIYGFVKQSHGHVSIDSEVGKGTTITLYFPRAQPPSVAPGGMTFDGNSLIVETQGAVRHLVARHLDALGFRLADAGDAAEALTILGSGRNVDRLFTGTESAGTGFTGSSALPRRPHLRIIFADGDRFPDPVHPCGPLEPATPLLPKPYRKEDLVRLVRQALGE